MTKYEAKFRITFNSNSWKEAQKANIDILNRIQEAMNGHFVRTECFSLKEVEE